MSNTSKRLKQFISLVGLPDFLISWIDRFYEPQEIELVLLLGRDTLDTHAVQTRWSAAPDCNGPRDVETFLNRSYKRGVLQRDGGFQYTVADFHARHDIWALFESWPFKKKFFLDNAYAMTYFFA
ncbi:MAG: hypothetical protein JRI93_05790 [Deltaproteobacteria bacterium]|nr:hypothetical protein [Deltaproteobacteria bacterium]MBW2612053.1 hypothetical protein [Deltaproteobacteria bacterium]MBW2677150.1 hypothetical protein [Deltaproteobacteria bacterium]